MNRKRAGSVQAVMGFRRWALVPVLWALGCGGSEKEANAPACPPGQLFDGRYCQMASTAPPPNGGSAAGGGTSADTPSTPPQPAPLGVVTASCATPATPIDMSAAQAVTGALLPLATQKGMAGSKPVGSPVAAQFQPGQCLETTITMSPGKCYSVVASALPTVQNLDLALVPSVSLPGLPQVVAASDNSVGPNAVIGEAPNCFKWALPAAGTMKLIVSVPAGQGLAAAQVFEK